MEGCILVSELYFEVNKGEFCVNERLKSVKYYEFLCMIYDIWTILFKFAF